MAPKQRFGIFTWVSIIVAVVIAVSLQYPQPEIDWEKHMMPKVKEWKGSSFHLEDNESGPLNGVSVVVTGATSGIGMGLAQQFIELGATVFALGRSPTKLEKLRETFPVEMQARLRPVSVELSNLHSIKKAADEIRSEVQSIDVLINNAGIHYTNGFATNRTPKTAQGHDLSFAVNYLSHVLLSEALIPLLRNSTFTPTIIQMSSTFHWAVDGSELVPRDGQAPLAAQPGGLEGLWRDQRAYANSKLAQLLHARALAREYPFLRTMSACPGWVATPIAGSNWTPQYHIMNNLAFPVERWGLASTLEGLFEDKRTARKHDFYVNTRLSSLPVLSWFHSNWVFKYGVRDTVLFFAASVMLFMQRFFPAGFPTESSPESYDESLQDALYEWSMAAVNDFR